MNLRTDQHDERLRLLEYLDTNAFEPVRHTFPDRYRERMRIRASEVQSTVMDLRDRYNGASSAEEIIQMFNADLESDSYQELSRQLKSLILPTFYDIQEGFMALAGQFELA